MPLFGDRDVAGGRTEDMAMEADMAEYVLVEDEPLSDFEEVGVEVKVGGNRTKEAHTLTSDPICLAPFPNTQVPKLVTSGRASGDESVPGAYPRPEPTSVSEYEAEDEEPEEDNAWGNPATVAQMRAFRAAADARLAVDLNTPDRHAPGTIGQEGWINWKRAGSSAALDPNLPSIWNRLLSPSGVRPRSRSQRPQQRKQQPPAPKLEPVNRQAAERQATMERLRSKMAGLTLDQAVQQDFEREVVERVKATAAMVQRMGRQFAAARAGVEMDPDKIRDAVERERDSVWIAREAALKMRDQRKSQEEIRKVQEEMRARTVASVETATMERWDEEAARLRKIWKERVAAGTWCDRHRCDR